MARNRIIMVAKDTGLIAATMTCAMKSVGLLDSDEISLLGVSVICTRVIHSHEGDIVLTIFDKQTPGYVVRTDLGSRAAINIPMQTDRAGTDLAATRRFVGGNCVGDLNAAGSPAIFPLHYVDEDDTKTLHFNVYNPAANALAFGVRFYYRKYTDA